MSSKPADATAESAIDLRYGQVGLLQARLHTLETGAILDELSGRVATAPQFFRQTAVCLDLGSLDALPEPAPLRAVIEAIRRTGMLVVGIADGPAGADGLGKALGLPLLSGFRAAATQAARPAPVVRAAPEPAAAALPTLVHTQPVRSGQRVYARERDLVVNGMVGAGAEVMADGCVHVYGSLRGRALAGCRGDTTARLFALEFRAELVAVAGVFRVFETLPPELAGAPVQVWLDGEELRIARLGA